MSDTSGLLLAVAASWGAAAGVPVFARGGGPADASPAGTGSPPLVPEIVIEPAPSFSNLKLKLSRSKTRSNLASGVNVGETTELQLLQPFKSSPFGAHVSEQGLGSVRSAQLVLTLRRTALLRPDEPVEQRSRPVNALQLLASVGHRSFDADGATVGDQRFHRVPYALGLRWEHRPGDPRHLIGRQKWGLGAQYRRQYLPGEAAGLPVAIGNLVFHGSVDGASGKVPLLKNGLAYRFTGAYDVKRGVPGGELNLSTALFESPRLILGLNLWVQGRDDDPRTRDKSFDLAPRLSVQF